MFHRRHFEPEQLVRPPTIPAGHWASGLGLVALGAGIMYLCDPVAGARRRSLIRDKFVRGAHSATDAARTAGIRARDHAVGYAHEARARFTEGSVDDYTLGERVRAQMGRAVRHPGSIVVRTEDAVVTLSGPILAHEVDELLSTVRSVRGVRDVRNNLTVHDTPANVPGLQGEGSRQSGG